MSDSWEKFLYWASEVERWVDLPNEERAYKLALAERLGDVRSQVIDQTPGWAEEFRKAVASTNLINQYRLMTLNKALKQQPEAVREALLSIWTPDISPYLLDSFADRLASVSAELAPNSFLPLGSVLLMTRDPGRFPPFRANAVKRWLELVGGVVPKPSARPSVRYESLLDFLDEFLKRAAEADIPVRDRLDAQGLAWTLTQVLPPDDWPAERAQAFLEWRGDAPASDMEPLDAAQRAWLVRPGQGGAPLVNEWRGGGFVSLAASYLPDVPGGADLPTVRAAIDKSYQHLDYTQRLALGGEYHSFLSRMKPDDLVVTNVDQQVWVGVVLGDPRYVVDATSRLRRPVQWSHHAHKSASLPAPIPSLLDLQGTVVELTSGLSELLPLLNLDEAGPNGESPRPPRSTMARPTTPHLPTATDPLAGKLHIPIPALQEIIDLLQARHQLVLYGPPGTGKTYVAQAIAEHIVGTNDPSRAQLVQFHPAYAYEDFFEGFRPIVTDAGQAAFAVQPGPLRRIASAALDPENQGAPFVLIIDEMNRANLAKVFGELYFLLEYRNKFVQLQYNPTEPFQLPENLFIIGTMNTADRSIAMVDAAIRRRFPFIELHPDVPPVRDVLGSYLEANHKPDDLARLLSALNAAIDDSDRDLRIGPSFLMRPEAETSDGLDRIWRYDILPLLDEHYYGRLTPRQIRARFGLTALLAQLGPPSSARPPGNANGASGTEPADET